VFDDTIEHEAWNDSDQLRVVLIADLWPPALNEIERKAVASVIPALGVGFSGGI
jgi:aspartyl/asparaginyl beta-hydroxylase (cupin superfamily)